jgi:hypothetical protein
MWDNYEIGITVYQTKKYETAAKYLKKAMSYSDGKAWQYAECSAMLGIINEYHVNTQEHLAAARHYYLIALQFDPKNKTAMKHLKILKEMDHHQTNH